VANPPNVQKVTTFFQDNVISLGWTETNYMLNTDINIAFDIASTLAGLRANWLSVSFQIPWIRVETLFANRQFVASPPFYGAPLIGQYGTGDALYPSVRLLCEIRGSGGAQVNRIFAGGLENADITRQAFTPTNPFLSGFNAWANALKSGIGVWSTFNRTNGGLGARRPISTFVPLPPRGNLITTDDNSTLFVGAVVRITGPAQSVQGLQGYKVVTAKSGATLFDIGGGVGVGLLPNPTNTFWQLQNLATHPVTRVFGERLTEKRPGRPFGLPVGRRSNRIPLRG